MEESFLNEIVTRVVAQVHAKMIADVPRKRVLMLFSGASTGYVVGMDTIRMLAGAEHDLTVFMTASAMHVIGEDNVRQAGAVEIIGPKQWVNTPGLVRESDLVLVPTLSMNTAARLALGLMDSLFSTLVLGALLDDKPVIAVCDGADPYGNGGLVFSDSNEGAPALRAQLASNLEKLIEFGVNLVVEDKFIECVIRQMRADKEQMVTVQSSPVIRVTPKGKMPILTAVDLNAYPPGTTLRLPANTQLTPLAQDNAAIQNLTLLFED